MRAGRALMPCQSCALGHARRTLLGVPFRARSACSIPPRGPWGKRTDRGKLLHLRAPGPARRSVCVLLAFAARAS
jgi:hypothetical protein